MEHLWRFLAIYTSVLALVPAGAHLAELPNKIGLSRDEYLAVQQIYRGWSLFGIVILAALVSVFVFTMVVRRRPRAFTLAMLALLCLVTTQVLFWAVTFPVNQATANWTMLPDDWQVLRARWEYSHAAAACFNLLAVGLLVATTGDTSSPLDE